MKYLILLLLASAAHADTLSFGAANTCAAANNISVCGGFKTDSPLYVLDSVQRTNQGKLTVTINNTAYSAIVSFIEDQVIQQQIGPQDGIILEHIEGLQLNATNGAQIIVSLKVQHIQHSGGGPMIKKHYTINTYQVQSGTVVVP